MRIHFNKNTQHYVLQRVCKTEQRKQSQIFSLIYNLHITLESKYFVELSHSLSSHSSLLTCLLFAAETEA